jgi:hypothetical protein
MTGPASENFSFSCSSVASYGIFPTAGAEFIDKSAQSFCIGSCEAHIPKTVGALRPDMAAIRVIENSQLPVPRYVMLVAFNSLD